MTLLLLSGCQAPKQKGATWTSDKGEVRPGPKTAKAVLALLAKARHASQQGSLEKAQSYLERAIRIEPKNAMLWLYMSKLRLYSNKTREAVNLAKKALALSAHNLGRSAREQSLLKEDCWRVMAHAYQKMGKNTKAQQAQAKANELSY
ncbi:MAG: tetratricopeptide repeat protein [Woeseiaceae bacterium]